MAIASTRHAHIGAVAAQLGEQGGTHDRAAQGQAKLRCGYGHAVYQQGNGPSAFALFTDGDFFRGFRIGPGGAAGAQKLLDRENSVPGSGLGGASGLSRPSVTRV